MENIGMIIYLNFVPVALMVLGSWLFVELVKYEHRRTKDND